MFLFKTLLVLAISNFVGSNYSHIDPNLSEHSKANSQSCNHDHIEERSESDCFCYDELSNDINLSRMRRMIVKFNRATSHGGVLPFPGSQ